MSDLNSDRDALRRRDEILSAVGFVANTFLQTTNWRDAIDTALERLGNAVGANRAYFFENHASEDGVELTSQRAEWVADGIEPQLENQDLQGVPWIEAGMGRWLQSMKERKPIYGLIADFPESEREILEAQQIQSLIAMPVFSQSQLRGFLGFDDCEALREWSVAEVEALLAATTALGAAIDRHQLENQLRFAQKMEAIGSLAAGVAHDFNNMLQAISAFTSIAKMRIDDESEAQNDLNEVLAATERAHCLTRQLLAFSRKQNTAPTNLDLNEICRSVITMIRPILGSSIELVDCFSPDAPVIHADSGLVSQALLNLCLNARDSMPDGGQLEISCVRRTLDNAELAACEAPLTGDYAVVSVSDNGIGIAPELIERIFEPFFTTKGIGQGTGLGLSVAYGSIQDSGGIIDLRSGVGEGTRFDVYFPLVDERVAEPSAEAGVLSGTETIMLVDDEPMVLASSKLLIESLGYRVLVASDGFQAIQILTDRSDEIDLIVTDTVMPGMDGVTLRNQALSIDQNAKVIMLSGYAPDATSLHSASTAQANYKSDNLTALQKPVKREELSKLIRAMLD